MNGLDEDLLSEDSSPFPDVIQLFRYYNQKYFNGLLASVSVEWSRRMTLCAGLCKYEKRGGMCEIKLSEPLLKFRTNEDIKETLLHESIHAYLFLTDGDHSRDGHGPEFLSFMNTINKSEGTNISVYHNFRDEVNLYRTHVWKCQTCAMEIKRSMNRAPAPYDRWWPEHNSKCGGAFVKIAEPKEFTEKAQKKKEREEKKKEKAAAGGSSIRSSSSSSSNTAKRPSASSVSGPLDKFVNKKKKSKEEDAQQSWPTAGGRVLGGTGSASSSSSSSNTTKEVILVDGDEEEDDSFPEIDVGPSSLKSKKPEPLDSIVECPICGGRVKNSRANSHVDACLIDSNSAAALSSLYKVPISSSSASSITASSSSSSSSSPFASQAPHFNAIMIDDENDDDDDDDDVVEVSSSSSSSFQIRKQVRSGKQLEEEEEQDPEGDEYRDDNDEAVDTVPAARKRLYPRSDSSPSASSSSRRQKLFSSDMNQQAALDEVIHVEDQDHIPVLRPGERIDAVLRINSSQPHFPPSFAACIRRLLSSELSECAPCHPCLFVLSELISIFSAFQIWKSEFCSASAFVDF